MGLEPSPLSSVLSFLLGEETSVSGLTEVGVADLERRLAGIVGEDKKNQTGNGGKGRKRAEERDQKWCTEQLREESPFL